MATDKPRVMISYARKDGEEYAHYILSELEKRNIPTWIDREGMVGGQDWWQQIKRAIDQAEFLVLIATKGSVEESRVCREEWRYARKKGVCVFPVQVPDDILKKNKPKDDETPDEEWLETNRFSWGVLPRWMSDAHFYDMEAQGEKLYDDLKSKCETPQVPDMAEPLPDNYVARPHIHDQTLNELIDIKQENPKAVTVALRGAGGFGKSVSAAAICHDDKIISAFSDGIVWITLGQNPDIKTALTKAIQAFSKTPVTILDIEQGRQQFRDVIKDRDCLIVIDDVWHYSHAEHFLKGGEQCARLITTRQLDVVTETDAIDIDVSEMTTEEAVKLLTSGFDVPEPEAFADLAKRLGEWPLLLDIARGMLQKRRKMQAEWQDALAYVSKTLERKGVTGVNRQDPDQRRESARGTISASLELLTQPPDKPEDEMTVAEEAAYKKGDGGI